MEYRIEHDSMGEVKVPADKLWGAQTERSHENFLIGVGIETMPREITKAFGYLKKAAALANNALKPEKMTDKKLKSISQACDEVISGSLNENFPLVVWQTGSGTQSNMNTNEVIANRANQIAGEKLCHPNDDINMSQSSNDTFSTAMHIAAVVEVEDKLFPAIDILVDTFKKLEKANEGIVKSGRTHLQDAVPIQFSQEISGWRTSLERDKEMLSSSLPYLKQLALGGTAVGTGLNAPSGFDTLVAKKVSELTGKDFVTAPNKFHALTSKDEIVFAHGALKALAADLMKIANDVRWLASGPRCGIGEIHIPENEPGWNISLTVPSISSSMLLSSFAAPSIMAVWVSWPQACILPGFWERNSTFACSSTGRASISPRSRMVLPGFLPPASATTPALPQSLGS